MKEEIDESRWLVVLLTALNVSFRYYLFCNNIPTHTTNLSRNKNNQENSKKIYFDKFILFIGGVSFVVIQHKAFGFLF